jgi:hypothetical protein
MWQAWAQVSKDKVMIVDDVEVQECRIDMLHQGERAIEHCLERLPDGPAKERIEENLRCLYKGEAEIKKAVVESSVFGVPKTQLPFQVCKRKYTLANTLLGASEHLLQLALKRQIRAKEILALFVDAWNAASCVGEEAMRTEMKFQNEVLRPQLDELVRLYRRERSCLTITVTRPSVKFMKG